MSDDVALPLRLSGAVWGHLIGDAIGVQYEFRDGADDSLCAACLAGDHWRANG